jgi:hypothetical protein
MSNENLELATRLQQQAAASPFLDFALKFVKE